MTRVGVYSVGHREKAGAERAELAERLRNAGCAVECWVPFRSDAQHRAGPQLIVLVVGDWSQFTRTDYLAAANALALHTSSLVRLLPVLDDGIGGERQVDSWAERNRMLWNRLRAIPGALLRPEHDFVVKAVVAALPPMESGVATPPDAVRVFVSYCHRDEELRDGLGVYLKLLESTRLIETWHDRKIMAGDDWAADIDAHMFTSQFILILLSPEFLESEYCTQIETAVALTRHQAEAARAIPVILRPCEWRSSPLSAIQALPKDAKPVTEWPSTDKAFLNVCEGILSSVLEWKGGEKELAPPVAVKRRVLDAAMPGEVELDKSAMLVVLIRKAASKGLRALLEADRDFGIEPEEVRSSEPVRLEFPLGEDGKPKPASARIYVRSPDFDPPVQERLITLPPNGDSTPVILMLAARKPGHLRLVVELYQGDVLLAAQPLSTVTTAVVAALVPGRVESVMFDETGGPTLDEDATVLFRGTQQNQMERVRRVNNAMIEAHAKQMAEIMRNLSEGDTGAFPSTGPAPSSPAPGGSPRPVPAPATVPPPARKPSAASPSRSNPILVAVLLAALLIAAFLIWKFR